MLYQNSRKGSLTIHMSYTLLKKKKLIFQLIYGTILTTKRFLNPKYIVICMNPILLHIYGPLSINAYGLCIALGLLVALYLAKRDPRKEALVSDDQGMTLLSGGIIAGILGGRVLHLIIDPTQFTSWLDLIAFWEGGFAELGSIIAITTFVVLYLYRQKIDLLRLMDLAALYMPIIQSFTRVGCFFAGCCYGAPTSLAWGVTYTNPLSLAPLCVKLHPAQLYAAFCCFLLFIALKIMVPVLKRPGQLFSFYFMGAGLIRFTIDFWRDDRIFAQAPNTAISLFSSYQWIALGIFAVGLISFILTSQGKQR